MKLLLLLILMFVVFVPGYSQNKWENTERRTDETPYKIECPDSNNCFVLTRTAKEQKNHQIIYKSKDQGKT